MLLCPKPVFFLTLCLSSVVQTDQALLPGTGFGATVVQRRRNPVKPHLACKGRGPAVQLFVCLLSQVSLGCLGWSQGFLAIAEMKSMAPFTPQTASHVGSFLCAPGILEHSTNTHSGNTVSLLCKELDPPLPRFPAFLGIYHQ